MVVAVDVLGLLKYIKDLAREHKLSTPYIVGGAPRDRVMGERSGHISDLDITTGDKGSPALAKHLSDVLPDANFKIYDDGHASIKFRGLRLDFSNNFTYDNIDQELKNQNVADVTDLKRELYSRDFTINTLLEDLGLKNIYDITGDAIGDIQARLLRCPVDPDIAIGQDPRRILRALKFSIKYGFKIEDKLRNAMSAHREKIKSLPQKYVQDRVAEIVRIDNIDGIDLLIQYKILPLVTLTKPIYDALIAQKKLNYAI